MYQKQGIIWVLLFLLSSPTTTWAQSAPKLFRSKNGLMGYRGHLGEVRIQPQFSKARPFSEGLAAVQKNGQWGFINTQGKYVIKPLYQRVLSFRAGYAKVGRSNLWGLVNNRGKLVVPAAYSQLTYVLDPANTPTLIVRAKQSGLFALLDKATGTQLTPFQYQYLSPRLIGQRLKAKNTQGKYGFLNKTGQQVIACQYDEATDFVQGKALVNKAKKQFYINSSGGFLRAYNPNKDAPVFTVVEQPPTPKGGSAQMAAYLEKNLQYPPEARANNTSGIVILQFIVESNGQLSHFKVLRGLGNGCNKEAIRLLKGSSPWNPGKQRGKTVRVKKTFVVRFAY
ncbi:TonB family protein [uncultured Microscilla sp.]|uniref:TonB family protein n=1 Tax=uncultured Microscilla sp. TaxID=432653 RepID=UPI0026143FDA|nr:TonB family protein [uncultured Microscilla sp.]